MQPEQRTQLLSSAWHLRLHEPTAPALSARLAVQENYIGEHLGAWLISPPPELSEAHSWHFMRYLDPGHLGTITGIVVSFRVVGSKEALDRADPAIRSTFEVQKAAGILAAYEQDARGDWESSVLEDYGGPAVAEAWAHFLAASSQLTVRLLGKPRRDFHARELVVESCKPEMPLAYPLIATFLLTGGRAKEVLGLRLQDVSTDRQTVTFRPNEFHEGERLKTKGSARTMPLWPQLAEILTPLLDRRAIEGGATAVPLTARHRSGSGVDRPAGPA